MCCKALAEVSVSAVITADSRWACLQGKGMGFISWRWEEVRERSVSELLSGEPGEKDKVQGALQKLRELAALPSTPRVWHVSKAWGAVREREPAASQRWGQRQAQADGWWPFPGDK